MLGFIINSLGVPKNWVFEKKKKEIETTPQRTKRTRLHLLFEMPMDFHNPNLDLSVSRTCILTCFHHFPRAEATQ